MKVLQRWSGRIFEKYEVRLGDNEGPVLKDLEYAIGHVELNGKELLELGEIEPIVGLDWSDKGAGQDARYIGICATPGSKLTGSYILSDYGILRPLGV